MTWRKREIIDMAREAGMNHRTDVFYLEFCDGVYEVDLEAFAKLVREDALAQPEQASIKEQPDFSCDSCGNIPDEEGWLAHGRGCYTQSEDGGGYEYIPHADRSQIKEQK
jgi:hypothetical protein